MAAAPLRESIDLRFRPRGPGRFGSAAFLLVWLCFWLAGELFALTMLGAGLVGLLTGQPPAGAKQPLQLAPALAMGAFLLVWVSFWTLGGILALRELLRLLWAEDRLQLGPGHGTLTRRLGPFTKTQAVLPAEIQRVHLQRPGQALVAQLATGSIELTNLGTIPERTAALEQLQSALQLPADDPSLITPGLPKNWQLITERGEQLLVPPLVARRRQAWVATGLAVLAGTGALLMVQDTRRHPGSWPLALGAILLSLALAWGAERLHRSRKEWRLERGRLVLQRRTGDEIHPIADSRQLELIENIDSDGDRSYQLQAWLDQDLTGTGKKPRHLTIQRAVHDPTEPRRLGHWLAQRTAVVFVDKVPPEITRSQTPPDLANSGKFGPRVLDWLDRARGQPTDR